MYADKCSGFSLQFIDGLLLGVHHYILLSFNTDRNCNKKSCHQPQNQDQQCFIWAILTRLVEGHHFRIETNYTVHEEKYNFTGINFPTSVSGIKIFEKK